MDKERQWGRRQEAGGDGFGFNRKMNGLCVGAH